MSREDVACASAELGTGAAAVGVHGCSETVSFVGKTGSPPPSTWLSSIGGATTTASSTSGVGVGVGSAAAWAAMVTVVVLVTERVSNVVAIDSPHR